MMVVGSISRAHCSIKSHHCTIIVRNAHPKVGLRYHVGLKFPLTLCEKLLYHLTIHLFCRLWKSIWQHEPPINLEHPTTAYLEKLLTSSNYSTMSLLIRFCMMVNHVNMFRVYVRVVLCNLRISGGSVDTSQRRYQSLWSMLLSAVVYRLL